MNDSKGPKRSIISYIIPYLLMATTAGLLVWLLISNFVNRTETWYASTTATAKKDTDFDLDSNLGYKLVKNADTGAYSYQYTEGATYRDVNNKVITQVEISQSYKAVTINGIYVRATTISRFTTLISEDDWNVGFEVIAPDGSVVNHASYESIFRARIDEIGSLPDGKYGKVTASMTYTDAFKQNWWDVWGPTIISTAVILIIGVFIFSRINSSVNGANNSAFSFNKSPARRAESSKVRFDDVAGCDEEKAEMVELVEYLKDPKKYSKFGARLPKGILLIGPPGTGKTLLAKAVAGEAHVPFYSISGSDFVEMYVGVGAGRVRDLFRNAKATAPCLIFIDEIDAVGRQRGAGLGGGNDEREQTLNQLLVEMDGFEANSGILVIAATNRDDVLDPALRRAGRFDRTITVSLPDKAGREAILKVHARNKKIGESVDFGALAKRTVGFSGADLDNVLNEAAILAVRGGKEEITIEDIDEAIDRRISGPAKSSKGLSDNERKQVAYHEAGHATIGIYLPHSDKVQKITIVPRGNTGGHVLMTPEDDRFLLTKSELMARITGLLGGRTSEEIFFQDVTTGASNDIEQATRLARMMVTELGMSNLGPIQYERDTGSVFLGRDYTSTQRNFSTQVAFEIDKAVREIIDNAHAEAKKLLEEHKDDVILIAETLLEKETITAEEIDALLKNKAEKEAEPEKEAPKKPRGRKPKAEQPEE